MRRLARLAGHGADFVAAGILAVMFFTFILQIVARYILNIPIGWTVELCLVLWVWLVFFTCAFCLRDRDHVTFDILYQGARPQTQRVFALVSAGAIVVALGAALPATWDYVDFLKIKRSATLGIRMKWVFIIYVAFAVVLILRYLWTMTSLVRRPPAPHGHEGIDVP